MITIGSLTNFLSRFNEAAHEKLVRLSMQSFQEQRDACMQALDERDVTALRNAAHDIKSVAGTSGDQETADKAMTAEKGALTNQIDPELEDTTRELIEELDDVIEVLRAYLAELNK